MGVDEVKTSFIRRPVLVLLKLLPNVGLRSDSGPHSRLKIGIIYVIHYLLGEILQDRLTNTCDIKTDVFSVSEYLNYIFTH